MSIHVLEALARNGFEEVLAVHDRRSGLRAFLAIHDTSLGPAFGGVRRWSYLDEEHALRDCLRLARSMTWKCALAGLDAGGAKLVVLDRPDLDVPSGYRFIGEMVERLGGRFYTGPDVGTGPDELAAVAEGTRFVTHPGPEGPGELADATAAGVIAGMAAALRRLDGSEDWSERTIVVQGLGEVGARVARVLCGEGARVLAAEVDGERAQRLAEELPLELIDPASELEPECDVFAPCALGGILHDLSLTRLRCRIVAGGANNVLASPEHGDRLHERGILYVPDFLVNSGALIRGAKFHLAGEREPVVEIGRRIGEAAERILGLAAHEDLPPNRVAVREAERRIEARRGGG
jgi:glutamate dehydrogenase/leucine dehydrogenase